MARKNQKLINYHTGKKTEMPSGSSVDYGEIVVRHNAESPELLIKIGDDSFGVFQASGAVQTAINSAVSTAKSELNTNISNLETKISDLSGVTKDFSAATVATYATKTELSDAQTAITNAYTTAIGDAKKAVYDSATTFATNAVTTAQNALQQNITNVDSRVTELSGVVESITTNINDNYVTTGSLETKLNKVAEDIATAKKEATDASSAYADTKFEDAKKYTDEQIDLSEKATNGAIEALESTVNSFKTEVANTYVTKNSFNTKVEELEGKISDAQTAATNDSKTYTDNQIANAFTSGKSYTDAEIQKVNTTIATVKSSVETLSGNVHTTIENLESTLTETINEKVAVAYRYQETVTNYADLPTSNMSSGTVGYVYNVEKANGNYPAGTNYAWNGTEWDALGGSVDLSPYATSASVKTEIDGIKQTTNNLQSAIDSVSSATKTLVSDVSAATVATYATKDELKSTSGSIITAYKKAVADAKLEAIGTASGYTDAQVLAAKNALKQSIETVDGRVTELSRVTETVKATADSAVQTASIVDGDTCKVSVNKVNTELKFDFRNIVIDCGEF